MKITNLYIGVIEKIYKKDISEVKPIFKCYPERQTALYIVEKNKAEDIKYGGIFHIGTTDSNEVGDYIISEKSLLPMFGVDLSDPVFQDEQNLEITKELVLKIYDNDIKFN